MKPSDDPLSESFADRAMESVEDDTLAVTRAAM